MYKVEVLHKLPIMQHWGFGSLVRFNGGSEEDIRRLETSMNLEDASNHHIHALGQEFPDCCGIPVPSAFAAVARERKPIGLVPFD